MNLEYEIVTSEVFDSWLSSLKDSTVRRRIAKRLLRVESGNFGDYKSLGDDLFELRLFFGGGFRIYYTLRDQQLVLLLSAGDKSTQSRDIERARDMLKEWK